jgi:hypothetical protein
MTKNNLPRIIIALVAIALAVVVYLKYSRPAAAPEPQPQQTDQKQNPNQPQTQAPIHVFSPTTGQTITSPVAIQGEAPGNWFFEGSFPIQVLNANNNVIGTGTAHAQGNWMTTGFVPFTASITFPPQTSGLPGILKFNKDNPSGLPQNDQDFQLPIVF